MQSNAILLLVSAATTLLLLADSGVSAAKGKKGKLDLSEVVNPDPAAANGGDSSEEYNEGMIEGDMIPDESNTEDRNAVANKQKLWPDGVVPYQDYSLSSSMKRNVAKAIADFEKYTCIKWVKRTRETDYVDINSRKSGCFAYKGRSGGKQPLNLKDPSCGQKGTIIHEMLHTLGFAHEQNRNDRDRYVTVHWSNMYSWAKAQFEKLTKSEEDTQDLGYDFASVMHYNAKGFSENGRDVLTTKDKKNQYKIGQRAGFSKQDLIEVNKLYKCDGNNSGVGGVNGCSDRATNCAKFAGSKAFCATPGVKDDCAMSCGACS